MVCFLMVLPTDTLDHHLSTRGSLLERVRKLDESVATGVFGLQEQLRAGETTGLPLKDWALLAHGEQYREFMKAAMLVGGYLAESARELPFSMVAVYAEWSHNKTSVGYTLHVGVLADGGMSVVPVEKALQIQTHCPSFCPIIYQERGDIGEHGRRHQNRRVYQNPIVLDHLITPTLVLHPKHEGNGEERNPFAYFESRESHPPHCRTRLQAGTDVVCQYLREFWKGEEPREATEFFREITQRITCEPSHY